MSKFKFVSEWPTNTSIEWWNKGRAQLNEVIEVYNQWQIKGFDPDEGAKVRAKIILGMQTFGRRDGGNGWLDELTGMLEFVETHLESNES